MTDGFMNSGWMGGWYGMIGGPFMMILILAAFVALIVFLVRAFAANNNTSSTSALELLEQRFARGEIGNEEFEQAKKTLRN